MIAGQKRIVSNMKRLLIFKKTGYSECQPGNITRATSQMAENKVLDLKNNLPL